MNAQDVPTDEVSSGDLSEAPDEAVEEEVEEVEILEAEDADAGHGEAARTAGTVADDACEPEPCDLDDEDMEELSPEDGEEDAPAADGSAVAPRPVPPGTGAARPSPDQEEAAARIPPDPRRCFKSQALAEEAASFLGGKTASTPSSDVPPGDEWLSHGLFGYAPFGVRCSADACRQDVEFSPISAPGAGGGGR